MNIIRSIIIISVAALLLSGCAQPDYKAPIATFQAASTVVIENAKAEYRTVNKKVRDAEIDKSVHRRQEIKFKVFRSQDVLVITKEDLEVRLAALDALKEHGKLLLKLANSDAPDEAKNAVNSFDDALFKLTDSLGKASSNDFKTKAGAFAAIAGEVTSLVMKHKINEALEKAILLSENDVLSLIKLLQDDLRIIFPELQRGRLSAASFAAIEAYNEELKKFPSDLGKLKKAAAEVKKAEDDWYHHTFYGLPDPGFEKMIDAHKKLVEYAKSPKTPETLADLVAAMDAFADQAKIIADAIQTIR
jgi:hypothetical protein